MARRVALARAIVMDPQFLIYDEPFAGLDPISMGVIVRLVRQMNDALGITSIVVSHDVHQISVLADQTYLLAEGAVVAAGSPKELQSSKSDVVRQFMDGLADGPVPFHYPAPDYKARIARARETLMKLLAELWRALRQLLETLGAVVHFLGRLIAYTPATLLRFGLVVQQVYNAGALSLVIIMLCGLFVGMVLGLQGFDLLQRFGSEESLGTAAALGLLKELGPVVTALLFSGRAGTALASEIGLMRATDQLAAMEVMAVDPVRRVCVPRFLGGVIAMPLLAAIFSAIGIFGAQLVGVQLMGVDSGQFWSQMRASVESLGDIMEGVLKSCVFGVACSLIAVYEGFNSQPNAEGVGRATTRTVVISAVITLILDYMLTAVML